MGYQKNIRKHQIPSPPAPTPKPTKPTRVPEPSEPKEPKLPDIPKSIDYDKVYEAVEKAVGKIFRKL